MKMPPAELERLFDESVPLLFQRQCVRLIEQCYTDAEMGRNTFGLLRPIADWHLPYLRRSLIESHLAELAQRFSPNLQVEFRHTQVGYNPYLAIKAGPFIITESKVDERGELPRDAELRTNNCAVNIGLFNEHHNPSDPLYCILTTVPHPSEARPDYVAFVFPDSDYRFIVHSIDLSQRFGGESGQSGTGPTPNVDPMPRLRPPGSGTGGTQA